MADDQKKGPEVTAPVPAAQEAPKQEEAPVEQKTEEVPEEKAPEEEASKEDLKPVQDSSRGVGLHNR
jgi:hypothetical protein